MARAAARVSSVRLRTGPRAITRPITSATTTRTTIISISVNPVRQREPGRIAPRTGFPSREPRGGSREWLPSSLYPALLRQIIEAEHGQQQRDDDPRHGGTHNDRDCWHQERDQTLHAESGFLLVDLGRPQGHRPELRGFFAEA